VHEKGIFPGTGNESYPDKNVYNLPLISKETQSDLGKGDEALSKAVSEFSHYINEFKPDLIFIACGADGHREDPLSSLEYSVDGIKQIGKFFRRSYSEMPILIGGAGGYLPDTRTPEVWSTFAHSVATAFTIDEDIERS
jgi:acetoin utilization deacetylase AcuC-like enzyme